jgi:hypothetical protein
MLSIKVLQAYLCQYKDVTDKYKIETLNFFNNITAVEIIPKIKDFDIIGLSCYCWNKIIINEIIMQFPNKKIVVGGPEVKRNEIIRNIAYITGEGEYPLFEYLMGYTPPEQPLSERPMVIPDEEILANPNVRVNIETRRGCNYHCTYCGYHKDSGLRYRKAETVIEELFICWRRGKKIARIVDANFFSNPEFSCKILDGLSAKGVKMRILFEATPAFTTKEILESVRNYIKKGGELLIVQGVQSLNKESLKAVKRPSGGETESILALTKAGATVKIDGILGLPFETKETYEKWLEYLCDKLVAGPTNFPGLNVLQPIEGTQLYDDIEKYGLKVRDTFVYETPYMTESELRDCIRMHAVIFRIFGPNLTDIRKSYTNKKFTKHVPVIKKIIAYLLNNLPPDSQFVNPKYPEFYYHNTDEEIPRVLILDILEKITVVCKKCHVPFPFQRYKRYCGRCEMNINTCRICGKYLETNYPLCFDHIIPGVTSVSMVNVNDRITSIQ